MEGIVLLYVDSPHVWDRIQHLALINNWPTLRIQTQTKPSESEPVVYPLAWQVNVFLLSFFSERRVSRCIEPAFQLAQILFYLFGGCWDGGHLEKKVPTAQRTSRFSPSLVSRETLINTWVPGLSTKKERNNSERKHAGPFAFWCLDDIRIQSTNNIIYLNSLFKPQSVFK